MRKRNVLHSGHRMDRGRAGKQSVLVMLLDTYAKSATPIDSHGVWVTDLSGNITWEFQGKPALFMGRHRNSQWTTASGIPTGRACITRYSN